MRNSKLFTKIFLYTFGVMLFVTVMAHVFLYVLAPQMTVSTNRFVEGAIIESDVITGILIKSAIGKALPVSLLCCAIISAGCSLLFSRAMTRPIKQIAETTEKMEKLDKAAVCVVHTKDEIGELAARVNKLYASLLSTIENLEEEKQNVREAEQSKIDFLRAASHELKTPLTSISGYAEIMKNGMVRPDDMPLFSERIYKEARRLITLVEDIIKLSKLDEESVELEKEDVNLYDLTREIISRLSPQAAQKDVRMELSGEPVYYNGIRQILDEMIYNVCENAVKYNNEGGRVTVWVGNTLDGPKVSVSDNGIGIPKEHQERIFERFYRVDKSHSKERGGTGLGLSIVKHGALLHGAKVNVESEPGKGTKIEMMFGKG